MKNRGFTLVEILVAVVILEVGLLGVLGTLWLAAHTLTRAQVLERGVATMEGVYDSLALVSFPSEGTRPSSPGEVRWVVAGSDLHMDFVGPAGDTVASVAASLGSKPR